MSANADGFARVERVQGVSLEFVSPSGITPTITYHHFLSDTGQYYLTFGRKQVSYNENLASGDLQATTFQAGLKRYFSEDLPFYVGFGLGYLDYSGELLGQGAYRDNRYSVYAYRGTANFLLGYQGDGGLFVNCGLASVYPLFEQADIGIKNDAYQASLQSRYLGPNIENELQVTTISYQMAIGYYF